MKSSKKMVEEYLKRKDWRVKENSNSPFSFGGLNKYITSEVSKNYWLQNIYPADISQSYIDGHIHIHDLGGLSLYCCGYSLRDILLKGVRGVSNIPVSAPAKHFDSVLNQVANLTTVFQNEIMGAVAFNSFDTLLAPFIKTDKLSYKEVKQSMQNYVFSICSNSRAGAEPAFSNLTFDLTPPEDLLNEYCIVGGDLVSFTYRSCQQEIDMLNRAFFEIMLEGDSEGKPFAYPIPSYNIHKRFDWDNPNNKLLWEMAGKYGTPYFANFVNSDLEISDIRSMCPLSVDTKILYKIKNNKENYQVATIKEVYNKLSNDENSTILVLSSGKEVECKVNKFDIPTEYEITLSNGAKIKTTKNHLNKVFGKDYILTKDLTVNDYLPVYNKPIELSDNLSYKDGILLGMYLIDEVDVCSKHFKELVEQFVLIDDEKQKHLNYLFVEQSGEFRLGILHGLRLSQKTNPNKAYAKSKKMIENISILCASLGFVVNENTKEQFNGKTQYMVEYYRPSDNKEKTADICIQYEDYTWLKITDISHVKPNVDEKSYCLEVLSENEPEEFMLANGVVTHNCRLSLNLKELRHKNGGLFGAGDSTGSIGVVTINLPRIAYENKENKVEFFKSLDKYLELAKKSLVIKRAWLQENIIDTNAIPAYMEYVGTLNNHFSTIGVVGMNEMCENFMGKDILTREGKDFCLEVGEHIRKKLTEFQEECGCLFNYEATPAESTCYRLALTDKKFYPDIISQGSGKDCYYTNSCHMPVSMVQSIDQNFKHQDELQTQFTGGTVIHSYLEGAISGEQAKDIVKSLCINYKVPYISLSPISRYCDEHGYVKETVNKCPICHSKLKMYQRITGYLRCVDNFNAGKKSEFYDRKQM